MGKLAKHVPVSFSCQFVSEHGKNVMNFVEIRIERKFEG